MLAHDRRIRKDAPNHRLSSIAGVHIAARRTPGMCRSNTERVEPLAMCASGNLAFSVWIERSEARVVGRDDYAPLALRVTHIFRRESGGWKIIHRHGDAVTEQAQTPPVQ